MEQTREKLLNFIKMNGPILPVQVSKFLNTNIIFAGAMLSELVANNHARISNTKKGGSPFYYVKGQESRLQNLSHFLPAKEKEVCDLLKEKHVIRDLDALPWQRVALRTIKDFAVPIEVEFDGNTELFWKWYLASNEEVTSLVSTILDDIRPNTIKAKEEAIFEAKENENNLEKGAISEIQEVLTKPLEIKQVTEKRDKLTKKRKKEPTSDFVQELTNYFNKLNIKILETNILKQEKEIDYIVQVPSNIGDLNFYLKAKNKSSITESDLALAYSIGQQKKLPILFASNGVLNKKSKIYLEKHLKGQLTFISLRN